MHSPRKHYKRDQGPWEQTLKIILVFILLDCDTLTSVSTGFVRSIAEILCITHTDKVTQREKCHIHCGLGGTGQIHRGAGTQREAGRRLGVRGGERAVKRFPSS